MENKKNNNVDSTVSDSQMENRNNNNVDSTVNDSQLENKNNNVDSTVNGGDLQAKQTNDDQNDGVHSSSTAAASSPVALYHPSLLMRQYHDMINRLVEYLNEAADELEALRRENYTLRAVNNDFKNESVKEGAVNVEKVLLPKNLSVSSNGYLIQDGYDSYHPALIETYEDLKDRLNLCLTSLREAAKESDKLRHENESLRLGSINSDSEVNKKLNSLTESSVKNHFATDLGKPLEMMIKAEAASGKTRGSTRIGNASQLKAGAGMQKNCGMGMKLRNNSFLIMNLMAFMSSALSLYLYFYKPCPTDELQKYHEELRQYRREVSEYKQDVSESRQDFRDALKTVFAGTGLRFQNDRKVSEERPTTSLFQSVFSFMNDREH